MHLPNLRRVRERRAWSQADLARHAGVGKNTVARLEEGRNGAHPRTAAKLAQALGVEPGVLMAPDRELAAAMRTLDKSSIGRPVSISKESTAERRARR
jgi:transcriptional regulator with XRE-family HTH domain